MTTQTAPTLTRTGFAGRIAYATLAALLLAAIVTETITRGTGYWQIAAFGFAPDLTLFFGAGTGLAQGQLHPRAVDAYNLMHRFWGPLAMLAIAASGLLSVGFLIGALTWAFHIAIDRSFGYGLRTPEGFQRP
ncbi:MAG: DUF4260 family protein [Gaiellaceae bacterium]